MGCGLFFGFVFSSISYAFSPGEKTKWVAIPAEELQAAADAQHRPHRHRNGNSRPRSQYQSHKSHAPTSGSTSTTGSISGQNSQGQSRTHSAMGTRQPGSHVNSVSHSQAQSRTGSTHSSPRQPGRGGRQLPDEVNPSRLPVPDVLTAANRSSKSSRATSPQPQGYPGQPSQDPASTIQSTALYPDPNAPQPHASQLLDPPFSEVGHTHYASIPPPLSSNTSQSYHSTHASNSPASNPYPLPVPAPVPTMYPLPSTIPANLPGHPYPGNPPFVGYPPYDYVYGAPYMHWPQGPDAVGSYPLPPHTHAYTGGLKLGQDSALPSSSTSRPPPPAESDPVAAYRDMGFVLPPPAAYTGGEPTDMERGRRRRELSFGTIGPSAGSPTSSSVSVEHGNEGIVQSVLELDIVDQTKKDGTESGEAILEKSFSGFSIGVSPGEPGPSRIRSRTRTQPKSVPTPRERVKTAPADLGGRRSEASRGDPMAEVNASVESSNLGEESSKWEFGTANHPEQDAQAPSNAVESHSYVKSSGELLTPSVAPGIGYIAVPQPLVEAHPQHQPPYAQRMGLSPLTTSSNGIPPSHSPSSAGVPYSVASGVSPSGQVHQTQDWEVKNFGWGFGQPNGALVSPGTHRDEQRPRDREGREYQRESGGGRPRRGSYGGAYGYDNRGGHERGGYPSRRGRGNGGFNRGFHGRNFSRGTYQQSHQSRQPPFNMTQTQTPPMPHPADHNPYYPLSPQTPLGTTYFHPAGYDPYAYTPYPPMPAPAPAQPGPPLPIPQTDVLFPLDSTTYYLLGQLEYYLSAQNLAQDIFLRKQVRFSRSTLAVTAI